jgi:cysteine desulfurase/selenocysteine lyase
VVPFVLDGVHAHDLGTTLEQQGVAVRAGHHCAMPVMQRFGVSATARASMAFYNTRAQLETLAAAIDEAREIFA